MKTVRAGTALLMAFLLEEKGYFTEEEIVEETGVAPSSFFLSLSDFRCFLQEHRPYLELVFDRAKRHYVLRQISWRDNG